jgi:hypothetical protein
MSNQHPKGTAGRIMADYVQRLLKRQWEQGKLPASQIEGNLAYHQMPPGSTNGGDPTDAGGGSTTILSTPTGPAGGDLSGTYPASIEVAAIRGHIVEDVTPVDGGVLVYESDTGHWVPGPPPAGGGTVSPEDIDDRVNALLVAGTGITKTYDDAANTLTLTATAPVITPADVPRVLGAGYVPGALAVANDVGVNLRLDADSTLSAVRAFCKTAATGDGTTIDVKRSPDGVAFTSILSAPLAIPSGTKAIEVTTFPDTTLDAGDFLRLDVLTVPASGAPPSDVTVQLDLFVSDIYGVSGTASLTLEEVDDRVASLLVAGENVSLTYDDAANTLTIDAASIGGEAGTSLDTLDDVTITSPEYGHVLTFDDGTGQWQNAPGVPGPEGPQGPQGPQGEIGLTGPTGTTGDPGPQGIPGTEGPQGPVGPEGPQGEQGLQGIAGPTGPEGPQGLIGPEGPQGDPGVEGPQGPIGLTGPQGETGADGAQGPQGPEGPQGPQGQDGPQGPQGVAGPQGPQGPEGPVGPLDILTDVTITEPLNNDHVLTYNAGTFHWENKQPQVVTVHAGLEGLGADDHPQYLTKTQAEAEYLPVGTVLDDLADTTINGPLDGQVLTYELATTQWKNKPLPTIPGDLNALSDVTLATPADKQILEYEAATSQWKNKAPAAQTSGYFPTFIQVWAAAVADGKSMLNVVSAGVPAGVTAVEVRIWTSVTVVGRWAGVHNLASGQDNNMVTAIPAGVNSGGIHGEESGIVNVDASGNIGFWRNGDQVMTYVFVIGYFMPGKVALDDKQVVSGFFPANIPLVNNATYNESTQNIDAFALGVPQGTSAIQVRVYGRYGGSAPATSYLYVRPVDQAAGNGGLAIYGAGALEANLGNNENGQVNLTSDGMFMLQVMGGPWNQVHVVCTGYYLKGVADTAAPTTNGYFTCGAISLVSGASPAPGDTYYTLTDYGIPAGATAVQVRITGRATTSQATQFGHIQVFGVSNDGLLLRGAYAKDPVQPGDEMGAVTVASDGRICVQVYQTQWVDVYVIINGYYLPGKTPAPVPQVQWPNVLSKPTTFPSDYSTLSKPANSSLMVLFYKNTWTAWAPNGAPFDFGWNPRDEGVPANALWIMVAIECMATVFGNSPYFQVQTTHPSFPQAHVTCRPDANGLYESNQGIVYLLGGYNLRLHGTGVTNVYLTTIAYGI